MAEIITNPCGCSVDWYKNKPLQSKINYCPKHAGNYTESEESTDLTHEETTALLVKAWEAHGKLLDMVEAAWGIIANAYGGEWDKAQNKDWKPAAYQWRDDYHEFLHEFIKENPVEKND